jgi:hypothetical protein
VYYRSDGRLNPSVLGPVAEIITLLFKREITKDERKVSGAGNLREDYFHVSRILETSK